jgi:DNA topoisomerase-1
MPQQLRSARLPGDAPPSVVAGLARLRYVNDGIPGIVRRRLGRHFSYHDSAGRRIEDPDTLERIRKLAIPPAWTDVWICPWNNGHLQATGRDARARKQYRYHARWRSVRDETKYHHMIAFGRALPKIRTQVERDLKSEGLPRDKILATIVRLLETTLIRVGNREYARENASYGLTTLRDRHVRIDGDTVHFEFRAKSGKIRRFDLKNRRLARIVKRARDLPGQELFQYVASDGTRHAVNSEDVNAYLKEAAGDDFTAKDFRTWAGTVLAAFALQEFASFDSAAAAKRNITHAVETVAGQLGNTVSICRKCYIHPEIFEAYLDRSLMEGLKSDIEATLADEIPHLSGEEVAVLAFLQKRLGRETGRRR